VRNAALSGPDAPMIRVGLRRPLAAITIIRRLLRFVFSCVMLHASWPCVSRAQPEAPPAEQQANAPQSFNMEQIDALLAPIALYPDSLLTQILMASTFPLQVVTAARWVEEPAHKGLSGDALTKALEAEPWDPSVKSLVPFPQVLAMMNAKLDWLQQLGYAFAEQQADVLNSVQRLRRQAQANDSLQSTPQQVVRAEQQTIIIEPAQPNVVYVPNYNPTTVYGAWPYPAYPPVALPPPPGYAFGTALATGLAFGAGVAITAGLWNWARPAWGSGQVNVNVNRYNNINANRSQIRSNVWQANRPGGRPAGLAGAPAGPVGRPARAAGLPAGAIGRQQVSVPRNAVNPPANRTAVAGAGANRAPRTGQGAGANRAPRTGQGAAASRSTAGAAAGRSGRLNQQSAAGRNTRPDAFSSLRDGRQATQFGQRGAQSRFASQGGRSMARGQRAGGGFAARGGGGRRR
jgi:hypothetical protein